MGKIISVANQKGGVGKTTTAVNFAACLGLNGKKVVLVDLDPQGNSTSGYGINKKSLKNSCYDVLLNDVPIREVLIKTVAENVVLLPSHMDLAGAELELASKEHRENRLKIALDTIKDSVDYIIIDCPPSLSLLTLNAMIASDSVLVPIQCEYYALEGLSQLVNTIRVVKSRFNSELDLEGVLLTMYDARLNLTMQVVTEVKKFFPGKVYHTPIPRNVRLSEAPSFGKPITLFDKTSKGYDSYMMWTTEFLSKQKV